MFDCARDGVARTPTATATATATMGPHAAHARHSLYASRFSSSGGGISLKEVPSLTWDKTSILDTSQGSSFGSPALRYGRQLANRLGGGVEGDRPRQYDMSGSRCM